MGYGFGWAWSGLGLVFMGLNGAGLSILEPIPNTKAGPLSKSGHLSHIFFRWAPTGLGWALLRLRLALSFDQINPAADGKNICSVAAEWRITPSELLHNITTHRTHHRHSACLSMPPGASDHQLCTGAKNHTLFWRRLWTYHMLRIT